VKLILQCSVCGTIHSVGTTMCSTCRATGMQDLRLLFECPDCFSVGLLPRCEACHPASVPIVDRVSPDPKELARLWGVDESAGPNTPPKL
jgi:rubredoxin